MKKYRRPVQFLVVIFLMTISILNQYESAKVKYHSDIVIESSALFSFIDRLIGDREYRSAAATFFRGNLWSMSVGPASISDPLAIASETARSMEFYFPFIITGLLPVAITLLLGRVFCGWICPMNLICEINDSIRLRLEKLGMKFFDARLSPSAKYWVLGIGLLVGAASGVDLFISLYPPRLISSEIYSAFSSSVTETGIIFIASIIFIELFFSRRMWCRYFCPGGALYSLLSGRRLYRMRRKESACAHCGRCDSACPLDIKPASGVFPSSCDGCASCVDSCDFGAMSAGFGGWSKSD